MLTLNRRILIILTTGLLLVSLLLGLKIPTPANADVGVHPILPGGSNIEPAGDTPIQMAAEVVTMNVRIATPADNDILQLNPEAYGLQFQNLWYPMVAEVQADFTMNNPTAADINLTTWFPLASSLQSVSWELNPDEIVPRIASFEVQVDGNPLDYSMIELPNPKGADKPLLPWASFPVIFPAGSQTSIQVSYLLPLTQAVKGTELALYYIFQTGAGWAGPIGQAELILNLPYPASSDTLIRVNLTNLNLPYPMANPTAEVGFEGVFNGNQARWTWTDFEPTAQDDFSVWLVNPAMWQSMQTARVAVEANPQDGQSWLGLANVYCSLSIKSYNYPSIFAASYLPLGLDAYQKAAELLPTHPVPHVGLAMLTLAPYMRELNAPSDSMQFIQDELQTARDLENAHPELANDGPFSSLMLEDSLSIYLNNVAATLEASARSTASAGQTQEAALVMTPSETPSPSPSLTSTVIPSASPKPATSTTAATPSIDTGAPLDGVQIVVLVAACAITLVAIAGFVVLVRMRRKK
jgi:hypothetical protein